MAPGPRSGTRFGPYELRSLLGKGGMGEVYEAYDTVKDRVVAVKLLSEELAKDPVYQVRFRRESQAAARLAEPHVIPIHDWGVIDGVLFIDMRLVPGVDLRALLRAGGPLSPARAVHVVEQIAAALDAAHGGGLVHRDVKPANILVSDKDFAYLADFGIAHTEGDAAVTLVGVAVGSYIYMAPERFDAGQVTGRADIYSLACVLHECLTGASPFPAASMNVLIRSHLSDPPPPASRQRAGVPAALDEVIARGMAKDPADRYATAGALAAAARAALTAAPPPRSGPTLVVRPPERQAADPTAVHLGLVPPESTGELSLPSIITPAAPTVVRPTETQFTPLAPFGPPTQHLSGAVPAPAQPTTQLPPVRPFPDAHLYPEHQQYGVAQPHSEQYADARRSEPTRRYPEQPDRQAPEYPPRRAPFPPPPGPAHGAPASRAYSEQNYEYAEDYYEDDPVEEGSGRRRSIVAPFLIAVAAIVVIAVGVAVGWQALSHRKASPAAEGPAASAPATPGRPAPTPGRSAPPTTKPSSVTLPSSATPCGAGSGGAALSHAAVGNGVTSCPFAEEVRRAYAESASGVIGSGPRSVVATSPVTGRSYTMTCASDGGLITCTGGENALVYVY
nr:serine/threonine-protein kinase [Nocardia panacis]